MSDEKALLLVPEIVPEEVMSKIHELPGLPAFMLAQECADLYQVDVKQIAQAVKRNSERFPADFVFRLTKKDVELLRSQNVTAISRKARVEPLAFSHEGTNALSGVLKSPVAAARSVQINRAFSAMEKGILEKALRADAALAFPDMFTVDQFEKLLDARVMITGTQYLALKGRCERARRRLEAVPPPVLPLSRGASYTRKNLTRREKRTIVILNAQGVANVAIASRIGRNISTIQRYLRRRKTHSR